MRRYLIPALFAMLAVSGCSRCSRIEQKQVDTSAESVEALGEGSRESLSHLPVVLNGEICIESLPKQHEVSEGEMCIELLPPLHIACNSSHIDKDLIRKLVAEGADVNEKAPINEWGAIQLTPLMIACDRSDIDVEAVKLLIELGADVNETIGSFSYGADDKKDYSGKTALMIACNRSVIDKEAIRVLVAAGADLNAQSVGDFRKMSPLMFACNRSEIDDEAIKLMIELGADVNLGNDNNDNSVMIATDRIHADIQASKILLDAGSNVNQIAENSTVLLMGGGVLNSLELTKKIVGMGADIHYVTSEGMSLLGYAAAFGSEEVVRYYIGKGLDVNHVRNDGQSVVMQAAWGNTLNVVKRLVKAGADLSVKANDGWTNLISVCNPKTDNVEYQRTDRPQLDVAKYLIDSGANVRDEASDGRDALTVLVLNKEDVTELVKLLLSKGADVNHRSKNGSTPLMHATNPNVVKYLLQNGADINAVNENQWNALHYAIRNDRLEAAQVLLDAGIARNAKLKSGNDERALAYTAETIEFLYKNGYKFNDAWTNISDYYGILNSTPHDIQAADSLLMMLKVGCGSDNPKIGNEIIRYLSRADIVPLRVDEIIDELKRRNPNVLNEPFNGDDVSPLTEMMRNRSDRDFTAVMIRHGAKFEDDRSPFEYIFEHAIASTEIVRAVIASGADVNVMIECFMDKPVPVLEMIVRDTPDAVQDALDAGANPNVADGDGFTPLMAARDVYAAKALLKAGANPNARLNNGKSVLMMYAERGDPEMVKLLLDAGAEIDKAAMAYADNAEVASLMRAHIPNGHYTIENLLNVEEITEDMLKEVMAGGFDLNKPPEGYNLTLLAMACHDNQGGRIKLLLKYGADPNILAKTNHGRTPLMLAVSQRISPNTMDIEAIRALIKAGAEINAQDESGMTPLMYATYMPHGELSSDIIRLLIESGADAKITTKDGRNVLFYLKYVVEPEIVKLLLEKGTDPKQRDAEGTTPLMVQCNPDITKILIDAGTDVSARTKDGKTALIILPEFCHDPASYQHLVEAGADINAKDNDGRNALYYAVHYRLFDVSKYLIKAGIDVNAKDNEGKTVIETLEPSPDTPDLVRMLLEAGATGTPQPGWDIEMFYEE